MKLITDSNWVRRGMSLLWDNAALIKVMKAQEAVTLRQFFQMSGDWPNQLPSASGNALVVVGLEGALDCLAPGDAETWLKDSIRPLVLEFQEHYESGAGLHFWLPGGRQRIKGQLATISFSWDCASEATALPLGRLLWSGAEREAQRILAPGSQAHEADGPAWQGIYQRRIS